MTRTILFWFHLVCGCVAGVVILIMSVTGVLLTYERQIHSWESRAFRTTATAGKMPVEALLAQTMAGARATPSAITVRNDPAAAIEVAFGRDKLVYVDPQTGLAKGEASAALRNFISRVEGLHRWLGVEGERRPAARAVTGACNLAFLGLILSGPFLWWPRFWSWPKIRPLVLFRGGLSGKPRNFNWHNVAGIWCALPLFCIVLSGVVMSYPWANNLLYRIARSEIPAPSAPGGGRPAQDNSKTDNLRLEGIGAAWDKAEHQISGWQTITLRLGRGPMVFTIDQGNGGRPDLRSQLTVDRRTGQVLKWEQFPDNNRGRRWRSWLRFTHTGEAGGIAGQTIAGLASAGGALLVWSGLALSLARFASWRRRRAGGTRAMTEPMAATMEMQEIGEDR